MAIISFEMDVSIYSRLNPVDLYSANVNFKKMKEFINLEDDLYPDSLREIGDCPDVLYFEGLPDRKIFENCLAVVGSRSISIYGKKVIEHMFKSLRGSNVTIVSGYMYGADMCAHEWAIKLGLRTIAVLGYGLGMLAKNSEMHKEFVQSKSLFITEYEKDFPPAVWTFPKRNRIIAALSRAILVIEAAENSGSIITAEYAIKYGKKLLAVPGSIFSDVSVGTNNLLKHGACMLIDPNELCKIMGVGNADKVPLKEKNSSQENEVLKLLVVMPLSLDELILGLGLDYEKAAERISRMELSGLIFEEGGKYHVS